MEFGTIFMASLAMGFSGAIMPGPLLTVTIKESLRRGGKVGMILVAGHALLELTLVIAIFYGLGKVIAWPEVKGTIGFIGGVFLLWMACGILREAFGSAILSLEESAGSRKLQHPFFLGITVSASNPYWSVWWATAGAGSLMLAANSGFAGAASFYSGHILSDFIWYTLVSFTVAKGKKLFSPQIYRGILAVCGCFLLGLACYFIYSGLGFWGITGRGV